MLKCVKVTKTIIGLICVLSNSKKYKLPGHSLEVWTSGAFCVVLCTNASVDGAVLLLS